jgi:iron complex transport system substrate-binding protein
MLLAATAAGTSVLGALGAFGTLGTLSGCAGLDALLENKRVLADHGGRQISIPVAAALKSVYFTSPLAQVFCFTVAPELLAGTTMVFSKEQLEYLPKGSGELEYMGSLSQGGIIDTEMLHYKDVQLVLSISGTDLTDVNVAQALALEEQTGIPVFLIDGSFDRIGETYRLLGECLGYDERGNELATYCENIYHAVAEAVSAVPTDQLVTYYYAEGPEGLLTEPDVSQHSLAFQVARGVNVAAAKKFIGEQREMVPVTPEQIVEWNPDFIITGPGGHVGTSSELLLRSNSAYRSLAAVKNDRVIPMPLLPFAFCDRPPGLNRLLGIQWLANLFYPDHYDVNMVETVREFYHTCYWRDLSIEQAKLILGQL